MINSWELKGKIEKWWENLDNIEEITETLEDINIEGVPFRNWGDKHFYYAKSKKPVTITYVKTFQSLIYVENIRGEEVYPILDIYIDIKYHNNKQSYKKVRCHVSC